MELTAEKLYFWLAHSTISPSKKNRLLEKFSIFELFDRFDKDKTIADFIGESSLSKLKALKNNDGIESELNKMYKSGVDFITLDSPHYPEKLKQKSVEPPIVVFFKGDIKLLNSTSVAIVGTRNCSAYGRDVAEMLANELSGYNLVIVSGMASGIDSYSQVAVVKNNGKTIAVLGSGLNHPTPTSNYSLFKQICETGVVVSEYPINALATKYTFPERNRIISGLSEVCIIVEASEKSGSLITANFALEQGREIFAVPGNITNPKSCGVNQLIKNGAQILTSPLDILSFFNLNNTKTNKISTLPPLDFFEQTLYNLLQNENLSFNELAERSGFTIPEVLKITASLQFSGDVVIRSGNIVESKKLRG